MVSGSCREGDWCALLLLLTLSKRMLTSSSSVPPPFSLAPSPFSRSDLLERTLARAPLSPPRLLELAKLFAQATELEIAFWDAAIAAGEASQMGEGKASVPI